MKPTLKLSITWRARLLSGALSGLALVALVALAQSRIRTVLYDAVDRAVIAQAEEALKREPPFFQEGRGGRGWPGEHNENHDDGNRPRPQGRGFFELGRGFFDLGRGRGPFGGGGEPPALRFGTASLLFPRRIPLDGGGDPNRPPWSKAGVEAARRLGRDLREERGTDGKTLMHVFSLRSGNQVLQTAANLDETEAALTEIQKALYALIVPVGLLMALLGALLTDIAFAPILSSPERRQHSSLPISRSGWPTPGGGDTFDQLVTVLNAMLGRLEAAFVRQKRFTADASHELRTPLAVIKAGTSFLPEGDDPLTERQRRTLSRADRTVDRANSLVSDLLLLARSENGTLPVHWEPVVLPELLTEASRAAEAGQPSPHAPVLVEAPPEQLTTDPKLLHRLIVNLVSNALRHTPPEGSVRVQATRAATLTLTVADTGEGIAPEHLERLGEPFYRPDASRAREQGGVGLGLALCKEIAATLGGTLEIVSTQGEGTTVTVSLPLQR